VLGWPLLGAVMMAFGAMLVAGLMV
jgi:hypothetical protein